jgi:hypothetical protein
MPSAPLEEDRRIRVFRMAFVPGTSPEPNRGFTDVGDQRDLDERNAGVIGQPIRVLDEVEAPGELTDPYVVAGPEVGGDHGPGEGPRRQPRLRRLFEGMAEHRTDGVDVKGQGQLVIGQVSASQC